MKSPGSFRPEHDDARWIINFAVWAILVLTAFSSAAAADLPVRMRMEPLSIRGRSGGGIPVQIKLEYNQTQILEGDLYLRIHHGVPASNRVASEDELIATIRYEGIVLQGTDYIFQTMLPPVEHASQGQYDIQAWFETDSGKIPLTTDPKQLDPPEPHELLSVSKLERATVLCSCSGGIDYQRSSLNRRFLNNALTLANYDPLPVGSQPGEQDSRIGQKSRHVQFYAAAYDVRDIPEDPLALCSFDVVLLADASLGRLEEGQMRSLKTWVEAGGSLCILPDDVRLGPGHVGFLQEMIVTDDSSDVNLSLTDEGKLLVISDQESPMVLRRLGLGRVALLPAVEDLSRRLSEQEVGQLVGFLWKVRKDNPIHNGQKWSNVDVNKMLAEKGMEIRSDDRGYYLAQKGGRDQNYGYYYERFNSEQEAANHYGGVAELHPESNNLVEACWEALMPSGVEMVPTWVIGTILVAYVLTIGPADYFVLGYFRKRKLTWLLFPLVTIFYTWLTVFIANRYMATTETGSWLAITDVIEDGRPIRSTSLKMHFFGTHRTVEEEATKEIAVPANVLSLGTGSYQRYDPTQEPESGRRNTVLDYNGRFPQSYGISQSLQQWSPRVVRRFSLSPDAEDVPKIAWDDASLLTNADGRAKLAGLLSKIQPEAGKIIGAVVLNGKQRFPLGVGDNMFGSSRANVGDQYLNTIGRERWYASRPDRESLIAAGLIRATWSPGERYFQLVSQVSPEGSASCEDLPIMDVSDLNQWALIIVVRLESGFKAYRKVYILEESTAEQISDPVDE